MWEIVQQVSKWFSLGEVILVLFALLALLYLKSRFVKQLSKIKVEFERAGTAIESKLQESNSRMIANFERMQTSMSADFDEMQVRLTKTSDHVKELVTELEGRTENLMGSMASLERALAKQNIEVGTAPVSTADALDEVRSGHETLKLFIAQKVGEVQDGRRRRKYEKRDMRSLVGIIDDLEYDGVLTEKRADAARDLNRRVVAMKFRPNSISSSELEEFRQLKNQVIRPTKPA